MSEQKLQGLLEKAYETLETQIKSTSELDASVNKIKDTLQQSIELTKQSITYLDDSVNKIKDILPQPPVALVKRAITPRDMRGIYLSRGKTLFGKDTLEIIRLEDSSDDAARKKFHGYQFVLKNGRITKITEIGGNTKKGFWRYTSRSRIKYNSLYQI